LPDTFLAEKLYLHAFTASRKKAINFHKKAVSIKKFGLGV